MSKIPLTLIFSLLLIGSNSCVSKDEHDKMVLEKQAIQEERDKLKQELDDIKFGAPNLLMDGKKFFESKDFVQARTKLQMLVDKHPDMPQSIEANRILSVINEEELWQQAQNSEDLSITDSYISKYPRGTYIDQANVRRSQLKDLQMQRAYDLASGENSSSGWRRFLERYPSYSQASEIRKRIIRLEVDEISGDRETGQMPTFTQLNTTYTSNSSVQITNNTGCELTVRYSGPDAEVLVISAGSTKSISLSSGNYKVAASACGANYAGSENLQGEYSSSFYIRTTRY
jgi:hypothetical protein